MMFANLFFLVVALLVITLSPDSWEGAIVESPLNAFLLGILSYLATLALIFVQNRLLRRKRWLPNLVNVELILFLIFYHFVLGSGRFFAEIPFILDFQGIIVLFSLILYLGGLGWYFYTSYGATGLETKEAFSTPCNYAMTQLRLLVPFTLPFLLLTFMLDLFKLYPMEALSGSSLIYFLIGTALIMVAIMIFFPPLIQKIWHCKPLPPSELKDRLQALCERAQFKHAGLKTWTVMNHSLTAAILGVVAPFRYVMFTERLLKELPATAIEAILAHEIGHQQRRHLLFYPLIIFGMMVTMGLFSLFFSEALLEFLRIQNQRYPSSLWNILVPLALFIPYVFVIGLYFRIVFGHFSRIFERQADLHVFRLGVSPHDMIDALDIVATSSGNTHNVPCWHHYSIQQRIDYLTAAIDDRRLLEFHDQKVRKNLVLFFILLFMGTLFLIAPLLPETYPFKTMNRLTQTVSHDLNKAINRDARSLNGNPH